MLQWFANVTLLFGGLKVAQYVIDAWMPRLNTIFENTFCLDFIVTYEINGKTETRELCEGGAAFCLDGQTIE